MQRWVQQTTREGLFEIGALTIHLGELGFCLLYFWILSVIFTFFRFFLSTAQHRNKEQAL